MFGTILADRSKLNEEQLCRYQGAYCGLCRTLKKEYGARSRMTLSYDMTFLILLLSSLYEPEEERGEKRCAVHPAKKRPYFYNEITSYAAAMNTALSYYKCLDDWKDERKLSRRLEAALLKKAAKKATLAYPHKCEHMAQKLNELSALEEQNIQDPDAAAKIFGSLTGELFVWDKNDRWAEILRRFGDNLGRFIYLSDALCDLEEDLAKGRYNPLKTCVNPEEKDDFIPVLSVILGDCMQAMDKLPLVQDTAILNNILYSGVWIPYHAKKRKKKEG